MDQDNGGSVAPQAPRRRGVSVAVACSLLVVVVIGAAVTAALVRESVAVWVVYAAIMVAAAVLCFLLFVAAVRVRRRGGRGAPWLFVAGALAVLLSLAVGFVGFFLTGMTSWGAAQDERRAWEATPEGKRSLELADQRERLLGQRTEEKALNPTVRFSQTERMEEMTALRPGETLDAGSYTLRLDTVKVGNLDPQVAPDAIVDASKYATVTYTMSYAAKQANAVPGLVLETAQARVLGADNRLYSSRGCTLQVPTSAPLPVQNGTVRWCRVVPAQQAERTALVLRIEPERARQASSSGPADGDYGRAATVAWGAQAPELLAEALAQSEQR